MSTQSQPAFNHPPGEPLRLHIGGIEPKPGWKILNIQAGPGVDFLGSATDLSVFPNETVDHIYGSHIYEHLDYRFELMKAFGEVMRVLKPGGIFELGVPDLDVLCRLFIAPNLSPDDRIFVMRMIYGGQMDAFDYHKGGYNFDMMAQFLYNVGFRDIERVHSFGHFKDTTEGGFQGAGISLNVRSRKPGGSGAGGFGGQSAAAPNVSGLGIGAPTILNFGA